MADEIQPGSPQPNFIPVGLDPTQQSEGFQIDDPPSLNASPTNQSFNWDDVSGLNKAEDRATRNKIFAQNSAPTEDYKEGDIWFDTNDNNHPYRADSSLAWVSMRDGTIAGSRNDFIHTVVFSATDSDTVAWTSGTVIAAGTTYSVNSGNTGNMAARTYIYLDPDVSTTVLQTTTTVATAAGKFILCSTINGTIDPLFVVFQGQESMNLKINNSAITFQNMFADGDDGDATISSNTTLARDMYYNNLTISSSAILTTANFRVFVAGTLTINSGCQISCKGNAGGAGGAGGAGSGGTGGTAGTAGTAGAALAAGYYAAGTVGVAGKAGGAGASNPAPANGSNGTAGNNGTNVTSSYGTSAVNGTTGGNGGTSGAATGGVGQAGGSAGTATAPTNGLPRNAVELLLAIDFSSPGSLVQAKTSAGSAGPGSGGGGANGNGQGGGGGGGSGGSGSTGGILGLFSKVIVNNGTITVVGGAGGAGGTGGTGEDSGGANGGGGGGGGAGGSGGNGGVAILAYSSYSGSGTITVAGGTAGSGGAGGAFGGNGTTSTAGAAGAAGNAGASGRLIELQV